MVTAPKGKDLFHVTLQSSLSREAGRDLKAGTEAETRGTLLFDCSMTATFLILKMEPPIVGYEPSRIN